jgi:hypothetical protein
MTDSQPVAPKRTRRRTEAPSAGAGPVAAPDAVRGPDPADAERTGTPPVIPQAAHADPPSLSTVLRVERGGIAEATAGAVDVHLGGIGRLDAEEVFVQWGGIGAARADKVGVELGSLGAGLAGELRVTQGFANTVAARAATIDQSLVRTLIAQRVTVNRPTGVLVMIAQHVSGDVRPVLDWRGALAAGAAFGLVAGIVRVLRGGRD